MDDSLTYKTKKIFWLPIKLSIVIGCGYFIYSKLVENQEFFFIDFYEKISKKGVFSTKKIILISFLSFFNWFLEILKWQKLASFCKKTNFKEAAIQSLASLTVSLMTPNRIGEYGAKALYFEKYLRIKIIGLNVIGNFYQLMATLFFGIIGFTYFVIQQQITVHLNRVFEYFIIIFFVVSFLFLGIKYVDFKISYVRKSRNFIKKIPLKLTLKVISFSFIRFLIFSHQFYFLLVFFHPDILYLEAISSISAVYLIASITPFYQCLTSF